MTIDELRELFLDFPGVEEAPSYGTPGFRLRKRLLARMHQSEDAVVLKVRDLDHQEALIAAHPRVFYLTGPGGLRGELEGGGFEAATARARRAQLKQADCGLAAPELRATSPVPR